MEKDTVLCTLANISLIALGILAILWLPGLISKLGRKKMWFLELLDTLCIIILGILTFLFIGFDLCFLVSSYKLHRYFPLITFVAAVFALFFVFLTSIFDYRKRESETVLNDYPRETVTAVILPSLTIPLCYHFNIPAIGGDNAEFTAELLFVGIEIAVFYKFVQIIKNAEIKEIKAERANAKQMQEELNEAYRRDRMLEQIQANARSEQEYQQGIQAGSDSQVIRQHRDDDLNIDFSKIEYSSAVLESIFFPFSRIADKCQLNLMKMDKCINQAITELQIPEKLRDVINCIISEARGLPDDAVFRSIDLNVLNQYGSAFVEKVLFQVTLPLSCSFPFTSERAMLLQETIAHYGFADPEFSRLFFDIVKKHHLRLKV